MTQQEISLLKIAKTAKFLFEKETKQLLKNILIILVIHLHKSATS